uniref:Saposin B-type domain-containing protein n=1 Tax=Plectus sambesii TaxID=2011161 RepID=A0A914W433_9BILA
MSTNKSSRQTCQDIKECPQGPVVKRQKRQNPQDQCRTCEIIINIAQYHFHNNINDQNALQQQLLIECQHLAQTEGPTASKNCINIVNANIAKIFADMKSGQSPRQTCVDIREC